MKTIKICGKDDTFSNALWNDTYMYRLSIDPKINFYTSGLKNC